MSRTEKFRDRIRARLETEQLSVAEAERLAGFARNYLDDFLSDRKQSMKPEAVESLARVLRANIDWLLVGRGMEDMSSKDVIGAATTWSSASRAIIDGSRIAAVGGSEEKEILILSLDIETGQCSFVEIGNEAKKQYGVIFDPSLKTARNVYARGMMAHKPVKVAMKKVLLENDIERIVIIDDLEDEKPGNKKVTYLPSS